MAPSRKGFSSAFTLLEVLVSTAILAIVVVLLATVFSFCEKLFVSLSESSRQRQDGMAILAKMADELRSQSIPKSKSYEDASEPNRQPQLIINPQNLDAALQGASSLFWETGVRSSKGGSGLVGYFVRWESTTQGPRPRLCRFFLSAYNMQPVLRGLQATASNAEWITSDLINQYAPGDASNGYAGWMADDVLAFYVRALDPNMKPIVNYSRAIADVAFNSTGSYAVFGSAVGASTGNRFDSRKGYQYIRPDSGARVDRFGPTFPAAVELILICAPLREIRKLSSIPQMAPSSDPSMLWSDVSTYINSLPKSVGRSVRIYSTVVPLNTP